MKYSEFRDKVKSYPLFRSNILEHLTDKPAILRRQLVDWVKQGKVVQLKKGMYTLSSEDRSVNLSQYYLANHLYSPSYISLETALSYYGLIPERVCAITSVSTKKTQRFKNTYGVFIYRHLKQAAYKDFEVVEDEYKNIFYIASPEKAIVDFFYFKVGELKEIDLDIFEQAFRLQNLQTLNKNKLKRIVAYFRHKKLSQIITLLIEFMEQIE
jgi:predicted transcriptional regulator of viral defense system